MKQTLLTLCLILFALPSWGDNLVCKYTGFNCPKISPEIKMFCEGLQAYYILNNLDTVQVAKRVSVKAKFTNNEWQEYNGQGISGKYTRECHIKDSKVFCNYPQANLNLIIDFNKKFLKIFDSGETHTFECFDY